jgi:hypothetical protein
MPDGYDIKPLAQPVAAKGSMPYSWVITEMIPSRQPFGV